MASVCSWAVSKLWSNSEETADVIYKGSCHCGNVAFEVEGEITGAMACNCSICSRKGALMWFVPRDKLRLHTAEADIATYTFNKHVIKHRFCPTCGMRRMERVLIPRVTKWPPSISVASKISISTRYRCRTSTADPCEWWNRQSTGGRSMTNKGSAVPALGL